MAWKTIVRPEPIEAKFCVPPDLSSEDRNLLFAAWRRRPRARAPYSHYKVGAAVRTVSGEIFSGCNVEINTYTEGTHAEQAAIVSAVGEAEGDMRVRTVAIVAAHERVQPPNPIQGDGWPDLDEVDLSWAGAPCGHCLQIINEFKVGPDTRLISYLPGGIVSIVRFGDALPFSFDPADIA
ncbi:MAG: cytidine deaminase [Patescibacteria group bacterium]|nr:cytidine deaminase [Patescibacteria group bacterium]